MRQYIGARYVPKIYKNSQDPSSIEWENTEYEPFIIVSYLNNAYISRDQVPVNAGNPTVATSHWAQIGFYNGQIANLQAQIDTINNNTIPGVEAEIDTINDTSLPALSNAVALADAKAEGIIDRINAWGPSIKFSPEAVNLNDHAVHTLGSVTFLANVLYLVQFVADIDYATADTDDHKLEFELVVDDSIPFPANRQYYITQYHKGMATPSGNQIGLSFTRMVKFSTDTTMYAHIRDTSVSTTKANCYAYLATTSF